MPTPLSAEARALVDRYTKLPFAHTPPGPHHRQEVGQ
jgi:hypothetical protein